MCSGTIQQDGGCYLIFLSLLSKKRPRMLTARTYGEKKGETVRGRSHLKPLVQWDHLCEQDQLGGWATAGGHMGT